MIAWSMDCESAFLLAYTQFFLFIIIYYFAFLHFFGQHDTPNTGKRALQSKCDFQKTVRFSPGEAADALHALWLHPRRKGSVLILSNFADMKMQNFSISK